MSDDAVCLVPVVVSPDHDGQRLDVFLAARFGRSRSQIRSRMQGQVCDSRGQAMKWSQRLHGGQVLQVRKRLRPEPEVEVAAEVIWQDPFLVAVDKGPGAPVHPTRSWRTRTVLSLLRKRLGDAGLHPAHRLDRETSGVLVFARTAPALRGLMEHFRLGRVSKRYLAVVRGRPGFERRTLAWPLARDFQFPVRSRMRVDPAAGREAVTEVEVLRRGADRALVAATPRTGRQHQIRVHLARLGHPVLGDKLYQQDGWPYLAMIRGEIDRATLQRLGHTRHALHAESLNVHHPVTGEPLHFRAPLPPDLQELVDSL